MKNIALLSILSLALLQPAVEAFFLGPIAVGAVIGALAVGKGFLLGSILSQRRSRKQSYRHRRSYTPYKKQHHYNPPKTYTTHYTKQTTVYPHKLPNFLSTSERDIITVMVGGSTEYSDDSYSLVDPSHSCSISLDPLPVHNMWDPIVAVVQDQMVACYIDYEHYITWGTKKSLCWQLRVDTRSRWTPVPSPSQGMFLPTSAVVGEKLLVIGGSLHYTYDIRNMSGTTLVQEYDIRSRTWAEGTRLPAPLFEGCAVETSLGVIVIGDFEAGNPNAYILDRSKWKPLPLSNYAHTNPGCAFVTINRKSGVLVISGSFVEFFSLWDNKWIKLPKTKVKRKRDIRPTVGMSHGQIVITGEFDMDSGEVSDIIEVWDGEEWMWRVASKKVKGNRIRQGDVSLPEQYAYNCYKDYTYKINDEP